LVVLFLYPCSEALVVGALVVTHAMLRRLTSWRCIIIIIIITSFTAYYDIMLGPMPGKRQQGGQKKQWLDDLKELTGLIIPDLVTLAPDRETYHRFAHAVARAR